MPAYSHELDRATTSERAEFITALVAVMMVIMRLSQ